MPKYNVFIHEERYFKYVVDAESEEEAEDMIVSGQCDYFKEISSDFNILEIEEVNDFLKGGEDA